MMQASERKLFLGPRLRRVRRELGLSQTLMAQRIGVSASYLNLIERNQRPVTAQVLLRLAESCNVDLRQFASDANNSLATRLEQILRDPLLAEFPISRVELDELVEAYPNAAEVILRLYRVCDEARQVAEQK